MVGWHHRLSGHEQTIGDSEGQESLGWCSPWDQLSYQGSPIAGGAGSIPGQELRSHMPCDMAKKSKCF